MGITSFAIVGGGFRSQSFLRVSKQLQSRFRVCGMVVRDAEKGSLLEQKWGVSTYRTIEQLLAAVRPDFVVVSVTPAACQTYLFQLARQEIPVLAETPPAASLDGLAELHRLTQHMQKSRSPNSITIDRCTRRDWPY